jgi:ABC-type nitrate/sulfonate/bicarbonate transport system substrate-binding protein
MFERLRRGALLGLLATLALWPGGAAFALDKVRLGKAVPNSFAFGATEVGIEAKMFEKEGVEIEVTSFRGDAQLQQALAAGSLDVGLGSGPGLGFRQGRARNRGGCHVRTAGKSRPRASARQPDQDRRRSQG